MCWIIDSLASAKNNYKHFSGEIRKLRRTVWSGSTKSLKWLRKVSTVTAEPLLVLSCFLLLKTNINKKKYDDIPTSASKSSIRRFVIVITEKAPTRAFSRLKAATTAFTFKTLLRHYAKWALTPRYVDVKLCPQRNYHKGRAAIRHFANLREPSDSLRLKL